MDGDKDSLGGFPWSCMEWSKIPNIVELLLGLVGFDSDGGFPVVPVGSPQLSVNKSQEQAPLGPWVHQWLGHRTP